LLLNKSNNQAMSSYQAIDITNVSRKEPIISVDTGSQNLSMDVIWDIMSGFGTLHNIKVCEYNRDGNGIVSAVIDFDKWNDDYMTRNLRRNLLSGDSELLTYDYKGGKQLIIKLANKSHKARSESPLTPEYSVLCNAELFDRHHR
jgi:hypothetical protein